MAEEYTMTTESCELIYLASKTSKSLKYNHTVQSVTIQEDKIIIEHKESLKIPKQVIFFE